MSTTLCTPATVTAQQQDRLDPQPSARVVNLCNIMKKNITNLRVLPRFPSVDAAMAAVRTATECRCVDLLAARSKIATGVIGALNFPGDCERPVVIAIACPRALIKAIDTKN
jgi:hypothetical protein